MSAERFAKVPEALFLREDITPIEKLVTAVLLLHRNQQNGSCFPSIQTIARLSGLGKNTVGRAIKGLSGKGILRVERRISPAGDYDSNQYTFVEGWPHSGGTPRAGEGCPHSGGRGSPTVGGGVPPERGTNRQEKQTMGQTNKQEAESERDFVFNPEDNETVLSPQEKEILINRIFPDFWEYYPRKVGKKAARKALEAVFADIKTMAGFASITENLSEHMHRQVNEIEALETEMRYIPHASTWLRANDFSEPPPPPEHERPMFVPVHRDGGQSDGDGEALLEREKG